MNAQTTSATTFTGVVEHAKEEMRAAFEAIKRPDGDPHPRLFAYNGRGLQTHLLPPGSFESVLGKAALFDVEIPTMIARDALQIVVIALVVYERRAPVAAANMTAAEQQALRERRLPSHWPPMSQWERHEALMLNAFQRGVEEAWFAPIRREAGKCPKLGSWRVDGTQVTTRGMFDTLKHALG